MAEARVPVIVGVGQINDWAADPGAALDSLALMDRALRLAAADSGVQILHHLDWLGVVDQISFPDPYIHHHLAECLCPQSGQRVITPDSSGDGPIRLINDVANLISSGQISVAAVVGGEAMRTANKLAQTAQSPNAGDEKFDRLAEAAAALALPQARRYGLLTPSEIYPLYENATRAAWGLSLGEAQAETAAIWASNSRVAAANPNAWLRSPVSPEDIVAISSGNRLISFPYTKLMVANNSVNQGAAIIVASLAAARQLGVPRKQWVFIGRGAAAHEPEDFLRRDSFVRSASMIAAIEQTLDLNGLTSQDLAYVELYSCFPCIPKMARRILKWPLHRPHSVYGGLTFGGAPVGNCMMHGAAAMVESLRRGGEDQAGLLFANGGYATHNHAIVLTRRPHPDADKPYPYDVQCTADVARGLLPPLLDNYSGPGTIESYIMPFDRNGDPKFATVLARTPGNERFLAHVPREDPETLSFLSVAGVEPVGSPGSATIMTDGRARWHS